MPTENTSLHPGLALDNSNTATALPAGLRRIGTGSGCTGKERDAETGLDSFGGRFTSADAPFADQQESDPQSWNLYSYVRNNRLRFIDPTGRMLAGIGESLSSPHQIATIVS
ncbi:MAG: hypothetical protein IPM24_25370 [Bryobacterales bacterium]|nr:hypothetical protein [Bryobacterales bacterium]